MASETEYEKTHLNEVVRLNRGHYDKSTVHGILRECAFVHVAFVDTDDLPQCIPMICALQETETDTFLYLHGYSKARLITSLRPSSRLSITATVLTGLVLALSAFHHSLNYRSAVFHGEVVEFSDDEAVGGEEKWEVARLITEHVMEGRWEGCRQPNKAEMNTTGYIKVRVLTASAKIRDGPPKDDKKDIDDVSMTSRVWAGYIPITQAVGEPVPAVYNKVGELPGYMEEFVKKQGN